MSAGALFGSNGARGASKNLVELKAGKMNMKGKVVYPDARKGQLYVYQSEDSLMHFCWKDRSTGIVEDDLIIFPDDCEFKHVSQCKTGRVYLLKFKSSSRKFFFWLQDLTTDKDQEYCRKINEVLNNPPALGSQRNSTANPEGDLQNLLNNMSQQQLMQLFGGVGQIGGLGSLLGSMNRPFSGSRMTTSSITSGTTTVTRPPSSLNTPSATSSEAPKLSGGDKIEKSSQSKEAPITSVADANRISLSDLQGFLSGIPSAQGTERTIQRGVVSELSAAIPTVVPACEILENAVSSHLPAGDNLSTTLSSPQFSQALSMFWTALQSGQVAPVIQQFGLSTEVISAANNGDIEQFVNALESEAQVIHSGLMPTEGKIQNESIERNNRDSDEANKKDRNNDDDEGMALD